MNVFIYILISLMACVSCQYNNERRTYYRSPYARTYIGRVPHGRSRVPFVRPPRRRPFGRPPWLRPLWDRPKPRQFVKSSLSYLALLRDKNKGAKTTTPLPTVIPAHANHSLGVYRAIKPGQYKADEVPPNKYLFIARVVESYQPSPRYLCTAACIEERIFITAARCLYDAKLYYSRVIYQEVILTPIAFVVPSKPTKDMFDDVGLIVVDKNFTKSWVTISVHTGDDYKRTDDQFKWTLKTRGGGSVAIGHVEVVLDEIALHTRANQTEARLYQLDVDIDPFLCHFFYNTDQKSGAFFVPCYSSCSVTEYLDKTVDKCYNYLGGEGHIIIGKYSNTIYGLATWGGQYSDEYLSEAPLPIGMAVPNSPAYYEDLKCAQKIKAAPVTSERFDTFCN